jgi:uncharacterized membrane protein
MNASIPALAASDHLRTSRRYLTAIAWAGAAGSAFSGSLVYRELVDGGGASCTATSGGILGVPVCVYGLAMFVAVTVLALLGLVGSHPRT